MAGGPSSEYVPPSTAGGAPVAWPIDLIGLIAGPVVAGWWLFGVDPGALTPEAHRLAAVCLLTIIWWVTEPIPIAATGLAAIMLCVFLGAIPGDSNKIARSALSGFGSPSVYFLFGGLFIGRAMERHGLDRRLAYSVLCTEWAGRSPFTLLAAVGSAVCVLSMWISNTAATAMVFPIVLGIIRILDRGDDNEDAPLLNEGAAWGAFARSQYASSLLLVTAYASSIGGVATPIGTATNVVAMGFFERPEYMGKSVDFLRWCLVGVPIAFSLLAVLVAWLWFLSPKPDVDLPLLRTYLRGRRDELGPWTAGQMNTLVVFLVVVSLWLAPAFLAIFASKEVKDFFDRRFPEEIVALMAPVLLFLLPVDWKNRRFSLEVADFSRIDWSAMLVYGSGIALGSLMVETGLAGVVGDRAFSALGTTNWLVLTALAVAAG
ncbi:MAG: SLC13 family permease, partial [Planctomycetia bacterium]